MSRRLVSVVLPTYNSPHTLRLAIESVLDQTYPEFELVIVGDGCTDDTAAVVESFDDKRIRWLNLPKAPGFGYANRNVALRQARGDLIAYLAHDDLWTSDHLQLMVGAIADRSVEFAYSRVVTVDERGHLWPTTCNLETPGALMGLRPEDLAIGIGSVVHTRECLDRFGYWDETGRSGGDHRLWIQFMAGLGSDGIAFVSEPTNLHFVAEWRRKHTRWWLPSRSTLFRRSGVYEGLLPEVLRVEVTPGAMEQQAVWAAMHDRPDWNAEMRRAVVAVLDGRLARSDDGLALLVGAASTRVARWTSALYRRADRQRIHDMERSPEPKGLEPE